MENKKLITALMVCCMSFLPVKAADTTISSDITGQDTTALINNAGDHLIIENNVNISNNRGENSGGIHNLGNLTINDGTQGVHATFQGNSNSAPWGGGGAIYSYASGTEISIGDYTSFEDNNKGVNVPAAGAVYVGNATQLAIGEHVNFSGNSAGQGNSPGIGGAMYIENSATTIGQGLNVEKNSAAEGGGLFIANPAISGVTQIGSGAVFEGNQALTGDGGALVSDMTNLTIGSGARFEDNIAAGNGGAISTAQTFTYEQAGKVTIGSGAQFTGNEAAGNGGAIYNITEVEVQGATFEGNSAVTGGAIYNTATVNVNGATFTGNKANKGGALYNAQNATATLQDVTFSAKSGDASNSIYNAGSVVTSSSAGKTNTFNSDIYGDGTITNTGSSSFGGDNSKFVGTFTQQDTGAETTVTGTFFGGTSTVSDGTLNWETTSNIPEGGTLDVVSGNLNIGNATGTTGSLTLGSESSVADAVTTTISSGSSLVVSGGSAVLGTGDSWSGTVSLNSGELSVSNIEVGVLNATGGTLSLDGVTLTEDTEIGENVTLGTMNGITNEATFTNDRNLTITGAFTNNETTQGEGSLTVTEGSNSGTIEQDSVTIASGGSNAFENSGSIETGTLKNQGSLTNTGSVIADTITNEKDATFTNNSNNVQAGRFDNAGEVKGAGSLTLGSGTNTGSITQNAITIAAGGEYNNQGSIESNSITNSGTFNNIGTGTIDADIITNNAGATFKTENKDVVADVFNNYGAYEGSGSTTADNGGENTSDITDKVVNISGNYNNTGTITATEEFHNTGTITDSNDAQNNSSITTVGGSNSGSITQDSVTIKGTFENTGSITTGNNFSNSGTITGNGGSITINNSGTNTGSITQDAIKIASGGSLISQGNDTSAAKIEVNTLANRGSVTLDNSILNVLTGNVTTGTINAIHSGNQLSANLTGGTLNIGNGSTAGSLQQTGGSVAAAEIVNITVGSTYDINAGSVILDKGTGTADTWAGTVKLTGGELTTNGFTGGNGALVATDGTLNIENSSNIKVGNGSSIAGDVTTKIDSSSTLNINNGGSVVLNSRDDWSGKIVLGTAGSTETDSKLDISGLSQNGTLQANSGTLDVGTGDLNISTGSYIENAVRIETEGNINISGTGVVGVDNNDTLASGSEISLTENGTLNYGNSNNPDFTINATSGNLNLLNGSQLTIDGSSNIADAVALDIQNGATLTLNRAELNLDNADQWDGKIINQAGGTINANGLINNSDTASLEQNDGILNVYNDAQLTLGEGSFIKDGEINITKGADGENGSTFTLANGTIEGGDMTIDENSAFIVKNGTFTLDKISGNGVVDQDGVMHAALVNVANGERVQHNITELAINGQTNFNMDIHARGNHYTSNDQFVVSSMTGNGTARIDNWSLNGDIFGWDAPIDRHITLDHIFVDENGNPLEGNIEITRRTEFTPIGYYQLNQKGSGTGLHYTLDLVDFNPQVFRGQVATVAQWMNQLAIDDMLFTHSMVLPSFKDEDGGVAYSGMMANRYASSNPLFAPYQYSRKDGGLWYKMYGTFENLNMNVSGLGRVGNNAYGALIGADFGLKELKNGWKFMPTAYVGYNGAHQAYPGIGAYQNGGQAGFLGTWYKNNFILGGLVYGGVYENSMDVGGHTDNAFNYFAGAATKFAYNWRFHRDWVLQPNLMAAYNFFGQQNWHSDYGQMGMMAGMLNGVNLAPGVNLIWEKETFSIYGTLQYMYNLNGAVGGRAGNVGLPQVEMERGYIQYGLGFTKKWGDRFSGYLQAVLRNAGRTGVGFQLGFNFLLGK